MLQHVYEFCEKYDTRHDKKKSLPFLCLLEGKKKDDVVQVCAHSHVALFGRGQRSLPIDSHRGP
jgi:hypothetical protein